MIEINHIQYMFNALKDNHSKKTDCKGSVSDDVVCGVARTRHLSLGFLA